MTASGRLFKFLRPDGTTVCTPGGFRWPLPSRAGARGPWCPTLDGVLEPGAWGYHAVRLDGLCGWALAEAGLFEVELRGDLVEEPTRIVAREARVLARVPAWGREVQLVFAGVCATRALRLAPPPAGVPLGRWAGGLLALAGADCTWTDAAARLRAAVERACPTLLRMDVRAHAAAQSVLAAARPGGPHTLAAASWCWAYAAPPAERMAVRAELSWTLAELLGLVPARAGTCAGAGACARAREAA